MELDKFYSATTELYSKLQLKEFRKQKWLGLLIQKGLDVQLAPFWTQVEKDLEVELWLLADAYYEELKAELKSNLEALPAEGLAAYWAEIGVEPQNLNEWL